MFRSVSPLRRGSRLPILRGSDIIYCNLWLCLCALILKCKPSTPRLPLPPANSPRYSDITFLLTVIVVCLYCCAPRCKPSTPRAPACQQPAAVAIVCSTWGSACFLLLYSILLVCSVFFRGVSPPPLHRLPRLPFPRGSDNFSISYCGSACVCSGSVRCKSSTPRLPPACQLPAR